MILKTQPFCGIRNHLKNFCIKETLPIQSPFCIQYESVVHYLSDWLPVLECKCYQLCFSVYRYCFLQIKAGLVEHPRYKEIRGIRVRDAVEENFELAQCYEVFANNGNEKIDKSVDRSEQCLVESEARRSALHEDTREKDKLESKIERLEVRFEVCSDMEVSDYFNCHASNVSILE